MNTPILLPLLILACCLPACGSSETGSDSDTAQDGDVISERSDDSDTVSDSDSGDDSDSNSSDDSDSESQWQEGVSSVPMGNVYVTITHEDGSEFDTDECGVSDLTNVYYNPTNRGIDTLVLEGSVLSHGAVAPPDASWPNAHLLQIDVTARDGCNPGTVNIHYTYPDNYRLPVNVGDEVMAEYLNTRDGAFVFALLRDGIGLTVSLLKMCDWPDWRDDPSFSLQNGMRLLVPDETQAKVGEEVAVVNPDECGVLDLQYSRYSADCRNDNYCWYNLNLSDTSAFLFSVPPGSTNGFVFDGKHYTFANYKSWHYCGENWYQDCEYDETYEDRGECWYATKDPLAYCYAFRVSLEE